jgi:uncharacterized lipoprotein YajG
MLFDCCRRFRALALVMFAAFLIAGCAIPVRERPIVYVPQENVQPTKSAAVIPVEVKVEDLQPDETFNPATDEKRFRVRDAAKTIKDAVETELRARGFKIDAGGALVAIQLVRFQATYEQVGSLQIRCALFSGCESRSGRRLARFCIRITSEAKEPRLPGR